MKFVNWFGVTVICTAISLSVAHAQGAAKKSPMTMSKDTASAVALKQDMRKLWTDHVVWTRDYIIAAVGDQPDAQAAGRLMKNRRTSAGIVKQFPDKFSANATDSRR